MIILSTARLSSTGRTEHEHQTFVGFDWVPDAQIKGRKRGCAFANERWVFGALHLFAICVQSLQRLAPHPFVRCWTLPRWTFYLRSHSIHAWYAGCASHNVTSDGFKALDAQSWLNPMKPRNCRSSSLIFINHSTSRLRVVVEIQLKKN